MAVLLIWVQPNNWYISRFFENFYKSFLSLIVNFFGSIKLLIIEVFDIRDYSDPKVIPLLVEAGPAKEF